MIRIMIDFETVANGLKPAIFELGYVAFDEDYKEIDYGIIGIDLLSSLFAGLDISQGTIDWWRSQSAEAKKSAIESQVDALTIKQALEGFMSILDTLRADDAAMTGEAGVLELIGNGMISDNVWLMSACEAVGINLQEHLLHTEHFCYRQEMKRALRQYGWNPHWEIPFKGTKHNSVDDCRHQIRCLEALEKLDDSDPELIPEAISLILGE